MLPAISNLSKPAGQLIGLQTCMQYTGEAPPKPIHVHACRYMSCFSLCLQWVNLQLPKFVLKLSSTAHITACVFTKICLQAQASLHVAITVLCGHSLTTTYSLGAGLHHDLF